MGTRVVKIEREALVRIEGAGTKQPGVAHHGVRLVVFVDPRNLRARFYGQGRGTEHEVLHFDFIRSTGLGSRSYHCHCRRHQRPLDRLIFHFYSLGTRSAGPTKPRQSLCPSGTVSTDASRPTASASPPLWPV